MTEELKQKLEKRFEKWFRKYLLCCDCERKCTCIQLNAYCEEQVKQAYIAGATENGIQWHDLRKDPNDLPKEKTFVISNMGSLAFYKNGMWFLDVPDNAYYFSTKEIIAWCEIPQFKE